MDRKQIFSKSRAKSKEDAKGQRRPLFDDNPQPMWLFAPETLGLLDVNKAAVEKYGYTRQEFLGMTIADIYPPEDVDKLKQTIKTRQALQFTGEWRHRLKDGRIINVEVTFYAPSSDGEKAILVVAHDVTEHKQMEVELRYSLERYHQTLDNMLEGCQIIDFDWRYVYINDAAANQGRHEPEELLMHTMMEIYPGIENTELFVALRRCMEKRIPEKMENEFVYPDGSAGWFELSIQPVSEGIFILSIDISERKRTENSLRESEERFRSLYENATIGMYRTTPDGKILLANPALVNMLGYASFEELSQRDLEKEGYEAGYERSVFRQRIESDGAVIGLESVWTRKDGKVIFVRESAKATRDAEGRVVYYEGTVEDITERKLAEERTREQLARLAALREIDLTITNNLNLDLTLNFILEKVARQLRVDAADVLLLNSDTLMLEYAAGYGFRSPEENQRARLRMGAGMAGKVALERKPLNVPDLRQYTDPFIRKPLTIAEGFVSYFGDPLIAKGKVIGVLEVFQRSPLNPDPDWRNYLHTLAGQTAIAVDSATLFNDLQHSNAELMLAYETTLEGWSAALDLRDKETEGHTQRVTTMSLELAKTMGMTDLELVHVRRGGLLHDIGKMGVPDHILLKPDKLTEDEWEKMRMHPVYAYDMLSHISYLSNALDIPYCHHEKWDGTGYPRGLKGEEIPLAARIFAVVDVYDALTSDRPYRKGWSREKTLDHIRNESGSHFDPRVVEAFLRMMQAN